MEGVLLDTNMANINDVERWLSLEEISKHVGCNPCMDKERYNSISQSRKNVQIQNIRS